VSAGGNALNVFLSYARTDQAQMSTVRSIVLGLVADSAVFVDTESLRAGARWEEQLAQGIARCQVFVVIWSWQARDSTWVQREVATALTLAASSGSPRVIPIVVDRTPLSPELSSYQAISAVGSRASSTVVEVSVAVVVLLTLGFGTVYAHAGNSHQLLLGSALVSMWLAIAAFVALRFARAPWNSSEPASGLLIGVLRMQSSSLTVLFLGAVVNLLLALALMHAS
jgi:hypothetical protein